MSSDAKMIVALVTMATAVGCYAWFNKRNPYRLPKAVDRRTRKKLQHKLTKPNNTHG